MKWSQSPKLPKSTPALVRKLRSFARSLYGLAVVLVAIFLVFWALGKTDASFTNLAVPLICMTFAALIGQIALLHERIIEIEGEASDEKADEDETPE